MIETGLDGMFIGELAERSHVGVETVRFYEREGLLPEPPRTGGGYRVYDGACPILDSLADEPKRDGGGR